MQSQTHTDATPWYRQGWPWFLISFPAAAVVGGIVTTVLAVRSADGVVATDYYRRGVEINEELARMQRAQEPAVNAPSAVDAKSAVRADGRGEHQRAVPAESMTPP